jgi:DNA-binding response OmpR family regulator
VSGAAPAARVLVVDDEEDLRALVSRLLRDRGYEVQEAADGEEALARIEAERPQLLVLDLVMPRLDGWGVLARLAASAGSPPVVVLTARGDYDSFARAVREGAAGYVFKPFRSHELTATCDGVLRAQRTGAAAGDERRRHRRRVVMAEVTVVAAGDASMTGELVDLSAYGARVHLRTRLEHGTRVRVVLPVALGDAPELDAVVQWSEHVPQGFAHGLRFADLTLAAHRKLIDLLGPAD